MGEVFEIRWEINNGCVGENRPQSFEFDSYELDYGMDDEDLTYLYNDSIIKDFQQKFSSYGNNFDEFLAWAKEHMPKD